MKRVFMSFLLMFSLGLTAAFAGKVLYTGSKVMESFNKQFEGAKSVLWADLGGYQKASFIIDGHAVEAYYNTNGELEGFGRHILKDELPLAVAISLKNRFKDVADFVDILEVSNTEGASYWLTVKIQNKTKRVQISPSGTTLTVSDKKQNEYF